MLLTIESLTGTVLPVNDSMPGDGVGQSDLYMEKASEYHRAELWQVMGMFGGLRLCWSLALLHTLPAPPLSKCKAGATCKSLLDRKHQVLRSVCYTFKSCAQSIPEAQLLL